MQPGAKGLISTDSGTGSVMEGEETSHRVGATGIPHMAEICGDWRLPPRQRILKAPDTEFDLHAIACQLTVVISTSVGASTPDTAPVLAFLESLQDNTALHWCRKIVVFDKVPNATEINQMKCTLAIWRNTIRGEKWMKLWTEKRNSYDEYCHALREMKAAN